MSIEKIKERKLIPRKDVRSMISLMDTYEEDFSTDFSFRETIQAIHGIVNVEVFYKDLTQAIETIVIIELTRIYLDHSTSQLLRYLGVNRSGNAYETIREQALILYMMGDKEGADSIISYASHALIGGMLNQREKRKDWVERYFTNIPVYFQSILQKLSES